MKKYFEWLFTSNRQYHCLFMLILALPLCLLFGWCSAIVTSIIVAGALEFKDVQHGTAIPFSIKNIKNMNWKCFDLLDFAATVLGGFIGTLIIMIL